ncbi:hypothetical protein NQ314_009448 [Rhamnusium bicolor]|uniref:Uncharacterized protein n=1 Tax=Rhamnusium bicolor TaxID=1586634 RepID=A0AAV8Y163_9CUCU|nr:hypothetical protein NQ314_009448 [Rhamnusium bicolor]
MRLQRITAWCLRFYKNISVNKGARELGKMSNDEMNRALLVLIRVMQSQIYMKELMCLKGGKILPHNSKLKSLDPFFR